MRKIRVQKTLEQRFTECETHLYFLWDARRLYDHDSERYKQVAAELRVLVGDHKPSRRLLLALMEETQFTYDVEPSFLPFGPIPMIGWRDDPETKKVTEALAAAMGDEIKLQELLETQKARARPVPLGEFIEKGLAVYIAPHEYSYRDLVLAISQQIGSGHEDEAVDEPLLQLRQFIIGGSEGHIAPLLSLADLIINVGAKFIAHLVKSNVYQPRYFSAA